MPLIVWREAGASPDLRYIPESPGMPKQDFLQRLIGRIGCGNRDVAWKDMNRPMGVHSEGRRLDSSGLRKASLDAPNERLSSRPHVIDAAGM